MKRFYKNGLKASLVAAIGMLGFNMAEADSPRMVVMEQFTNSGCGPCAQTNPYFHAGMAERLDFVIPLAYHSPGPDPNDPMYQEDTQMNGGRMNFNPPSGVPASSINGGPMTHPGNHVNNQYSEFDALKGQISPIDIEIMRDGRDITVSVTSSVALQAHTLRVVLVQEHVEYASPPGSNGEREFPWVPRQMLPNYQGTVFSLGAGGTEEFELKATPSQNWDMDDVYVVAFVQNDQTKEILQGGHNIARISAENDFEPVAMAGSSNPFSVELTNENDYAISLDVEIDPASKLGNGITAKLDNPQVTIPANGSVEVTGTIDVPANTAGYPVVDLKYTPSTALGNGDYLSIDGQESVAMLSNSTKKIFFNSQVKKPEITMEALSRTEWASEIASVPLNNEFLTNFGSMPFDLVIFPADRATAQSEIGEVALSGAYQLMSAYVQAGANVIVISDLDLYNGFAANDGQGIPNVTSFYQSIGVANGGNPIRLIPQQFNGSLSQVYPFSARGEGDIFSDINIQVNAPSSNWDNYKYFLERVNITNSMNTEVLMRATTTQSEAAETPSMVGATVGNSKIIFSTFGLEVIPNENDRNAVMDAMYTWIEGEDNGGDTPSISVNKTTVDFGAIEANEEKTDMFTIRNNGDADLIITSIALGTGSKFTIDNMPSGNVVLSKGATQDISVTFMSSDAGVFNDAITIMSNDTDNPTTTVTLTAEVTTSVTEINTSEFSLTATPNVFSGSTVLNLQNKASVSGSIELFLMDAAGNRVRDIYSGNLSAQAINLDATGLAAGKYFVIAQRGGQQSALQVIVQ